MPYIFKSLILLALFPFRAWAHTHMFASELTQSMEGVSTSPFTVNPLLISYHSRCALRQTFDNKAPDFYYDYHFVHHDDLMRSITDAKKATVAARKKIDHVYKDEVVQFSRDEFNIHKPFLKEARADVCKKWMNFLFSLIEPVQQAKLRNDNLGFCSEAAYASVIQSLWTQLHADDRENIHFIEIIDRSKKNNHNFVLYNAKIIENPDIAQGDLAAMMQNLQPQDPQRPIIVCDSWVNYHGPASGWYTAFSKDPASSNYTDTCSHFSRIVIKDFSIPSWRAGVNDDHRKYLKETALKMLSGIFSEEQSVQQNNTFANTF